jgi:FkbM family methyltransferase
LKPRLPERPVILDIGASDGRWTREILKTFQGAAVFLFEPGAAYTAEIQATLDSHERLQLFPIAIGERDGPVTFHVHSDPQGSTTFDWHEGNFATQITVPNLDCNIHYCGEPRCRGSECWHMTRTRHMLENV